MHRTVHQIIRGTDQEPTQRPTDRWGRRRLSLVAAISAAVVLTACGGGSGGSAYDEAAYEESAAYESASAYDYEVADENAVAVDGGSAPADASGEPANAPTGSAPIGLPAGRDIIVTIDVALETDNLRQSIQTILNNAATAGGYLANSDIRYDDEPAEDGEAERVDYGYASLVVRVPTQSTQGFVDTLAKAGTITTSTQATNDVTNQRVDLDVRIANATDSVETVRALLDKATDLTDVVTLESELNRRVTDLELLEAQRRGLSDQIAMSTINVTVFTAGAPAIEPEDPSVRSSFEQGWDAFTSTVGAVARAGAMALPFIVTGLMLLVALGWVRRRIRARGSRRQQPSPTAPTTNPPTNPSNDTPPTPPTPTTDSSPSSTQLSEADLDEQRAA